MGLELKGIWWKLCCGGLFKFSFYNRIGSGKAGGEF